MSIFSSIEKKQFWVEVAIFFGTIITASFIMSLVLLNHLIDTAATCEKVCQEKQCLEPTSTEPKLSDTMKDVIKMEVWDSITKEILELNDLPLQDPRRDKIRLLENELYLLGGGSKSLNY